MTRMSGVTQWMLLLLASWLWPIWALLLQLWQWQRPFPPIFAVLSPVGVSTAVAPHPPPPAADTAVPHHAYPLSCALLE